MKEIELIDKFCLFLSQNNWIFKREVRKSSYYNEGFIDIVILKNDKFIAIESKINGFQSVYSQASGNSVLCDYSYILYPKKPNIKYLEKCEKYGIGIIIPCNDDKSKFEILLRGKYSIYQYSKSKFKIQRNWNENRIGRFINQREIPSDYDLANLEKLKPNYDYKNKPLT